MYDALEVVYPVQNGDVKAAQNSVQIVNETAERPASTTSTDQQGTEEGPDGDVSTATGEESSNGTTVTVEVWAGVWEDNRLITTFILEKKNIPECINTVTEFLAVRFQNEHCN